MDRNPKENPSRYDVSGNVEAQYLDAAQTVLVNKQGATDLEALQVLEEEALAKAYGTLLSEVRTDTPMTCDQLRHIHDRIFGELYEWAGRWRAVQISKAGGHLAATDFPRSSDGWVRTASAPEIPGVLSRG